MNKLLLIAVLGVSGGCSMQNMGMKSEADGTAKIAVMSNSDRVAKMAEQAIQACGKGNVKSVSIDNFSCKNP